jgi:hypothetical protein
LFARDRDVHRCEECSGGNERNGKKEDFGFHFNGSS